MTTDQRRQRAATEKDRLNSKYGHKTGGLASDEYKLNVVPTGCLAMDYATGIGGWPVGQLVLVFGPRDIGKSSIVGIQAIRSAQKLGKLCGIVALEPGVDGKWLAKHGVDPELVVIARPNTAEDAFGILYDWVTDDIIDFMVLDSIGAAVGEQGREDNAKNRVGGESRIITDGTKRLIMPTWKNNKGVILLNQIRDDMSARIAGMVKPPGGHGQEHFSAMIVQLKPGKTRYKEKIAGDEVVIGQEVRAVMLRNKMAEGSRQVATFDFYQRAVEGYPFGIDVAADVIAMGMKVGAIEKAGSYYRHPSFPEQANGNHQLQGKDGVAEYIHANPKALDAVRADVLQGMFKQQSQLAAQRKAKEGTRAKQAA